MARYRQTMTLIIDVVADSPEEATEIAQEEYEKWESAWWIPDTTVVVPEDDDDYYPINVRDDRDKHWPSFTTHISVHNEPTVWSRKDN